ncbi:MAG TPA: tetratricopeptide repeat protein [Verrucomicrobiales bacterium]|nr:tetratricopeptide repeat protein [Verrucomicrobiales bacterium]
MSRLKKWPVSGAGILAGLAWAWCWTGTVVAEDGALFPAAELSERARVSLATVAHAARTGEMSGQGTGFVISADGLVATNLHVIGEGRPVVVTLADGRAFSVREIWAWDRKLDLAILRIDAENLVPLPLADGEGGQQGEAVLILGNPQGLAYSVVQGVVSARREIDGISMLQLAIPVEPGNSGGPVLNSAGEVIGVVTMKSAVTENLGFAMPSAGLRRLLEDPNPVPAQRWITLGRVDPNRWEVTDDGARWFRRGGMLQVKGLASGFGGRTLCLSKGGEAEGPFELAVRVRLEDEAGAAGLAFAADGGDRHYGFYATSGKLRLTHFDGPTVYSWNILEEIETPHYFLGEWNHLRIRWDGEALACYVNGRRVMERPVSGLTSGRVGLCRFREPGAQFKGFRLGADLSGDFAEPPAELMAEVEGTLRRMDRQPEAEAALPGLLADEPDLARGVLEREKRRLQERLSFLEMLSKRADEASVLREMALLLGKPDPGEELDMLRGALIIARVAEPELDCGAYMEEIEGMIDEVRARLSEAPEPEEIVEALREYLFVENGFHGSRLDYYNWANSHLNAVLDDREGIPISLSVLFIGMARGLGLESLKGIGLPGHFVVQNRPLDGEPGPLLDVFDGANELSREQAEELVWGTAGVALRNEHLEPVSDREILVRMLRNLVGLEMASDDVGRALPYLDLLLLLSPEESGERFQRTLLRFQSGRLAGAREDLLWLLERRPLGLDYGRLEQLLRFIEEREGE